MSMSCRRILGAAALFGAACTLSTRSDAQDVPAGDPAPGQEKPSDPPPSPAPPAPVVPADPAEGGPAAASPAAKPAEPASTQPPVRPEDVPPTDEEDAAARKVLAAAAERQGGASLAPPDGNLESFRVVFRKVVLHRQKDGTSSRVEAEEDGLKLWWKGTQIRTEWRIVGERPTVRAVLARAKPDGTTVDYPWMTDGKAVTPLLDKERFKTDLDEIERDRSIVQALLDVAVLRRMLHDGSRWKLVDDPLHAGTALRRSPPADAKTPLRVTLWVDPKSNDVTAAKLSPNNPGESTMHYSLAYHPEYPKVRDGVLRFPFEFHVREQRVEEQEPMPVMDAWASEASFNDVDDASFRPPAPR